MTLEEAIRTNQVILDVSKPWAEPDEKKALGLGIEALKFRKAEKEAGHLDEDDLLPGETKE